MSTSMTGPLLVAAIEEGRWVPGIGDPTPMGWATVVAYLLAATACVIWARPAGTGRLLPIGAASLMALLAINKQLDLQSLFTEIARDFLKSQGWHEDRRELQAIFIGAVAVAMVFVLGVLAWALRHRWREAGLAVSGLVVLSGFILIRAASFHNVDHGLGQTLGGLKWNWILELGGIGMIFSGAIVGWLTRRSKSAPIELDAKGRAQPAESVSGQVGSMVEAPSPPKRTKSLEGFVVRPIRLSDGPRGRSGTSDRPMSPPGVAV